MQGFTFSFLLSEKIIEMFLLVLVFFSLCLGSISFVVSTVAALWGFLYDTICLTFGVVSLEDGEI